MVGGHVDVRRWRHAGDRSGQEGARKGRYVHAHDGLLLWSFAHGGGGLGDDQWEIWRRERRLEMGVRGDEVVEDREDGRDGTEGKVFVAKGTLRL